MTSQSTFSEWIGPSVLAVAIAALLLLIQRRKTAITWHSTRESLGTRTPSWLACGETVVATIGLMWAWTLGCLHYVIPALVVTPFTLISTPASRAWAFSTTCWHSWTLYRCFLGFFRLIGGKKLDKASGALVWRRKTRLIALRSSALLLADLAFFMVIVGSSIAIRAASGLWAIKTNGTRAFHVVPLNMWVALWVRDLFTPLEVVPLAESKSVAEWNGRRPGDSPSTARRRLPDHVLNVIRPGKYARYLWNHHRTMALGGLVLYTPIVVVAIIYRFSVKASLIVWGPLGFAADVKLGSTHQEIVHQVTRRDTSLVKLGVALCYIIVISIKLLWPEDIKSWLDGTQAGSWIGDNIVEHGRLPYWQACVAAASILMMLAYAAARWMESSVSAKALRILLWLRSAFYYAGYSHLLWVFSNLAIHLISMFLRNISFGSPFR